MKDEILLQLGNDGNLKKYNDEFDIIIHCETEKDREDTIRLLKRADRLRWHDVNKEMPKDDVDPLAKDCSVEDPADEWMFAEGSASFGTSFDGVTHWMYQPDAPDK